MKKHKGTKFIILITVALLFTLVLIPLMDAFDLQKITKHDDITLYINNDYDLLNDNEIYKKTSNNCKDFLPKYNDFIYRQFVKEFYIFDGSNTMSYTSISFVLELQFDNIQEYKQFLLYENERMEYTDKFEITYKEYNCFLTTDTNLTYYYYEENIPFQFGMLCQNEKNLLIRYIYFRECESSVDKNFNIVFKNTNCNW